MEPDIKEILERRIKGAEYQIAESERKIATEELYRNKWQIRKDAFVNILEEWNEANKQNADIELAKEAMNTHVHVNVELNADEMAKISENYDKIIANNPKPFDFKPQTGNGRVQDRAIEPVRPCKVFTEIEPFKEVPAFEVSKSRIPQQIGKAKAYVVDDNVVLYREQYHINIYTTLEEIKRMKALPEMTVKLTLQDYEKRTYPNKAVVLRHFLRDLKDVNELKVNLTKPEVIPTYSNMGQVDEIKK